MHKKDGNKGLAHTDPLASYLTGHKRLALPIILLMLMLLVAPLASATTASVTCANAIIDVGQYQSCNAVLAGYSGSGTFTYNFTVANTLSASPSFMWYVPQYDAYSAGVSTLMALSSKVVLTEGEMFPADFSATGALSYYTQSFSDTQINSIITGEDNNGIQACLTIGGSSQAAASWTTLLGSLAEQNALIANVVNAVTTGKQLGTLPYNCIELDAEGTITTGTNGILWTSLADKLKFNITAQNANDLLNDYGCSCGYNNTGGTTGFNWNALVPYINYFDIAAYNGNGDLKNFITKKGLQPGQLRVSWDLLDAVDPAENVFPFAYYVDNVSNDIASGYGISVFNSQALSTAANQVALQAIASNTLLYTYMTHNNIYTAVTTTSNTFTFQVTASDATTNNDIQKAKARITDANGNTISSQYSATFQVNSQLKDAWSVGTNPITEGSVQTLTATTDGGTGTSPWSYNIIVYAANGVQIYNSLSPKISAVSNSVSFSQLTAWGSGTFTANVFITDSASTPNVIANTLTYTVTSGGVSGCGTEPAAISALIVACFPANIVNTQTTATAVGFQQMFPNTPFNAMAGNVVVYNSISGALMPAWVENSSLIWVNLEGNTIAASGHALDVYYFGVGSSSTNFFLGANDIGEAPQLTCNNPANTITGCAAGQYGKYDNGANVFTNYQNFAGTSVPAGWYEGGTTDPTIDNGVTVVAGYSGTSNIGSNWQVPSNLVSEELVASQNIQYANGQLMFLVASSSSSSFNYLANSVGYQNNLESNALLVEANNGGAATIIGAASPNPSLPAIISVWNNIVYANYSSVITLAGNILGTGYLVAQSNSGYNASGTLIYARQRIAPPNGIMPTVYYGAVGALAAAQPTPYRQILDRGQSFTLTSNPSGGVPPYTYQWYTGTMACGSLSSIGTAISSTYVASPSSNTFYCYIVTDSSLSTATSSSASNVVVNGDLMAGVITPASASIDLGQSITLTSNPSGGTPSYSYQWYIGASCVSAISGATANTYVASPSSNTLYSYQVTDSASVPVSVCSSTSNIVVWAALGQPSISPSGPSLVTPGQTIVFSTSFTGGTPNYIYRWTVSNAVTRQIINQTTYFNVPSASNTFTFTVNSLLTGNTLVANVIVIDSAYSTVTANSINSGVVSIGTNSIYSLISTTPPAFPVYETSSPIFTYVVYVNNALATGANVLLYGNGTLLGYSFMSLATSSQNSYSIPFIVPLVTNNNIAVAYNAVLLITTHSNTITNAGTIATSYGNTIWNYYPSLTITRPGNPANVLVGDNITANTVIGQINNINGATGSGYLTLGNQTLTESVLSQYSYSAKIVSLIPSTYALTMPSYLAPQTYTINSIVQLSYNSQSVYRNVSTTLTTYNESLTACGSPQGYSWNFYNSSNTLELWPQDVLVVGHFSISKNGYASQTILGTSIGFTNPATANVYSTCIYPSWGKFNVSGIMQYSTPNTINSTYQLNQFPISNSLKNINLYLLWDTVPQTFNIYVQNNGTQQYIASQVVVYQYNIATNQSVPISTLAVPAGHSATIVLQIGDVYIFQAFGPSGSPLYATSPQFTASGCGSSTCNYLIQVTGAPVTNPPSPVPDVGAQNCIVSLNTPTTNAVTLSCSWHSGSGASYNISLLGYKSGQAGIGPALCTSTLVASAGSVQCVFYNTTTNQYYWYLALNNPGYAGTQLKAGVIGVTVNQWGSDGLWVAVLAIIVLATVMLTKSIGVSVILFDIGFTVFNLLGFIKAPFPVSEGFLYVVSAVLLYLINRHD